MERNRIHNIGVTLTQAAIEATTTGTIQHAIIADNFFDSNGAARHIVLTGTAAQPHRRVTIRDNKHTEATRDCITLTYVNNSTARGGDMAGIAGAGGGRGIVLDNCTDVDIADVSLTDIAMTAVVGTNNTRVRIDNAKARNVGSDTTTIGHGFDFDSTNTSCEFTNLSVEGADGWGFIGDPVASSLNQSRFSSCALGTINSTTLQALVATRTSKGQGVGSRTAPPSPSIWLTV